MPQYFHNNFFKVIEFATHNSAGKVVFFKLAVLKHFANFRGKYLQQLFLY